jgi:hypothetical protein
VVRGPGHICGPKATATAVLPPRCSRNAPLTLPIAPAEPGPKDCNNPDDIRDGINWAEQTFGAA